MRGDRFGLIRGDVVRLFEGDSVAGLDEGELLGRFADRRDEAAFEALVGRLGPMVLGVCRRMLADPHDVDDAFQATFLVLVRRAGSIRDRDLVAPWLHGVALRVARRARLESGRRKARERLAVVAEAVEDASGVDSGWPELRSLIDEEIGRLPEDHRRAVVLCDVEGLSREEAALRLGWTLNMVRGRLERARGRLRGQLARRGVAPSGGWMALMIAPPGPPAALLASTVRASLAFSTGRIATGLASASAVALSQGVCRMMTLAKWKLGLAAIFSASLVAGGSGMLAAQAPGEKPAEAKAVADDPAAPGPFRPRAARDVARARVDQAGELLRFQDALYQNGRSEVDRVVEASRGLMQAEFDASPAKAARIEAARTHHDHLKKVLAIAEARVAAGRATGAEVMAVKAAMLDAEFALARELEVPEARPEEAEAKAGPARPAANSSDLNRERVEIARRLYDRAQKLSPDQISGDEFMEAAITLAQAEAAAATTRTNRIAAIQDQVARLREAVEVKEKLANLGQATHADADRLRLRLLDAQSALLNASGRRETWDLTVAPAPDASASIPGDVGGTKGEAPSTLAWAVAAFNREAMADPVGREQPPLTEDEVVAAVRFAIDHGAGSLRPGAVEPFRAVAEARKVPTGTRIEFFRRDDRNGRYLYEGWWVRIVMSLPDGGAVPISIRSRMLRSITLEQALDQFQGDMLKQGQVSTPEARAKVSQLRTIIEALESRVSATQARERAAGKGVKPF